MTCALRTTRSAQELTALDRLQYPWRVDGVPMDDWIGAHWRDLLLTPDQIAERAVPYHETLHPAFFMGEYGTAGVYFLMADRRVTYVGMSTGCIHDRVDVHADDKGFTEVCALPLPPWPKEAIRQIEAAYIDLFDSPFNRQPEQMGPWGREALAEMRADPGLRARQYQPGDATDSRVEFFCRYPRQWRRHYASIAGPPRRCPWEAEQRAHDDALRAADAHDFPATPTPGHSQ